MDIKIFFVSALFILSVVVSLYAQNAIPDGVNFIGDKGVDVQSKNENKQSNKVDLLTSPLTVAELVLVIGVLLVFNLSRLNPIITAIAINAIAIVIGFLGLKLQSFEIAMGPQLIVIIYLAYRIRWRYAKKDGSADKRYKNNYQTGPGFSGIGKHCLFSMGLLIIMFFIFLYVFKW
jgi:hypothetical protein